MSNILYSLRWGNPGTLERPSDEWRRKSLVTVPLPWPMRSAYDVRQTVKSCTFHRKAADRLLRALVDVWEAAEDIVRESNAYSVERVGLKQKYGYDKSTGYYDNLMGSWLDAQTMALLRSFGGDLWGGSWVHRYTRGYEAQKVLSPHAYGIAVDINPAQNPMGSRLVTTFPGWFVDAWKAAGFKWGGEFKSRFDAMHFEIK